jgi:hypothetical protein
MADAHQLESFVDAGKRMGGMFASVYKDSVLQTDIPGIALTVTVARIDIPLVGQDSVGHKRGRVTREGTLSVQKIDSRWELFVWNFLTTSHRDQRTPSFDLKLSIDDPDAYGVEAWQLYGCQLWSYSMGAAITDDQIGRDYPMTWAREEPIDAFEVQAGGTVVQKFSNGSPTGG